MTEFSTHCEFVDLRITLELESPIVTDGTPIHFDGLCASMKMMAIGGTQGRKLNWEPEESVSLPFAKMSFGGLSWWRASAFSPPIDGMSRQFSARRFDWDECSETTSPTGARKILSTADQYKALMLPFHVVSVPVMEFFAVGNRQRVKRLIKSLKGRGIGKKTSVGWGLVGNVIVEKFEHGNADWRTSDNRPARNLPIAFCIDKGMVVGQDTQPIMPPYWGSKRVVIG